MASFNHTHWMITNDVEHYYDSINKTQWLAPDQMRELQDEKLRRLIRHAYRNVPYYRVRMQEAGLRPEDIRTQEDLVKLPMLSKADVRAHLYFDIMSENHNKDEVLRITTSGSTGETVRLLRRPAPARNPLGSHAPLPGMDRIPLRRSLRAAVAPDARHVEVAGLEGEGRRGFPASQVHPGLRDARRRPAENRVRAFGLEAGVGRRLRRGAEPGGRIHPRQRRAGQQAPGGHVERADAACLEPQGHRRGVRLQGLRQVRRPRVLGHCLRVRGAQGTSRGVRVLHRRDPARRPSPPNRERSARS